MMFGDMMASSAGRRAEQIFFSAGNRNFWPFRVRKTPESIRDRLAQARQGHRRHPDATLKGRDKSSGAFGNDGWRVYKNRRGDDMRRSSPRLLRAICTPMAP